MASDRVLVVELSESENWDSSEEEERYTVEDILDERISYWNGSIEYLIKWEGYNSDHNSWEPAGKIRKGALETVLWWEESKKRMGGDKNGRWSQAEGGKRRAEALGEGESEGGSLGETSSLRGEGASGKRARADESANEDAVDGDVAEREEQLPPMQEVTGMESPKDFSTIDAKLDELKNFMQTVLGKLSPEVEPHAPTETKIFADNMEEMDSLRAEIARLKEEMRTLNLFQLCRREPEKMGKQKEHEHQHQLQSVILERDTLKKEQQHAQEKISMLEGKAQKLEESLKKVALVFSSFQQLPEEGGSLVDGIDGVIPQVQRKITENARKAAMYDSIRYHLRE